MELINLHDFIEKTIADFDGNFFSKDRKLPEAFKEYVKSSPDGDKFTFSVYTTTVTSSDLKIYCPNQWFYIAAYYCKLYPVLQQYKDAVYHYAKMPESQKDHQAFFAGLNDSVKAKTIFSDSGLDSEQIDLLTQFVSDYKWWRGGKGIERNDFYYSPILSSAALVNQSQAYVADICKYLVENPLALTILTGAINGKSMTIISEVVAEGTSLVKFMEQSVREFLSFDPNFSRVNFKKNSVTIDINGCKLGRLLSEFLKVTDPRRKDDCNADIKWTTDGNVYCFYKEQSSQSFQTFKSSFNSLYREKYKIVELDDVYKLLRLSVKQSVALYTTPPINNQVIFYGAPGTGKSYKTSEIVCKYPETVRITFHPDSDYSTFVGAYKPTTVRVGREQVILDYDSLVDKFKEYIQQRGNMTVASTLFGHDFHDSIVKMQPQHTVADLVTDAYKSMTSYDSVVRGGMSVYEETSTSSFSESKIEYKFVKQAFLKAYVKAWNLFKDTFEEGKELSPQFLVIEEINRGNCAQIFGDLFQLLDRKKKFSEYPVEADEDIRKALLDVDTDDNPSFGIGGLGLSNVQKSYIDSVYENNPIAEKICRGELLVLPPNLFIWATMNTSDQSLFPIDSAFKRRWEWKYVKIKEGKDSDGKSLDWKIVVKDGDDKPMTINGEDSLSWWKFILKVNEIIASMTSSADKQLGYFFCKAENGVISGERFVSKVIFYLWNDVFKDTCFEDASLFRYEVEEDGKKVAKDLTFPDFYDEEGEKVNGVRLVDFLQKVMAWQKLGETE